MTRWIDGSDWNGQRAMQLARLLGSEYRDDAEIELLLGVCDIRVGLLPTINKPEVKWFTFAKSLHSEGALGRRGSRHPGGAGRLSSRWRLPPQGDVGAKGRPQGTVGLARGRPRGSVGLA